MSRIACKLDDDHEPLSNSPREAKEPGNNGEEVHRVGARARCPYFEDYALILDFHSS